MKHKGFRFRGLSGNLDLIGPDSNRDMAAPKRNSILQLSYKDKATLYAAYMPFVSGGGLFVPSRDHQYSLGDEVFMLVTLPGETEKLPVAGRVVWVTPKGAQGKRPEGFGVQFSEQDGTTRNRVEEALAGALESERPTHTM